MCQGLAPDGHAHADLARPLGDAHQHDVHDPDAADDERDDRDRGEERRERLGALLLRVRDLGQVADVEVVVVGGAEVVAIAQDRRDLRLRARRVVGRDRAHQDDPGDELLEAALDLVLEGRDRDVRDVVVVRAHRRLALAIEDPDDEERHRRGCARFARPDRRPGRRACRRPSAPRTMTLRAGLDRRCRRRASPSPMCQSRMSKNSGVDAGDARRPVLVLDHERRLASSAAGPRRGRPGACVRMAAGRPT